MATDLYEYTVDWTAFKSAYQEIVDGLADKSKVRFPAKLVQSYQFPLDGSSSSLLTKDGKPRDRAGKLTKSQREALAKMHKPYIDKWLGKAETEVSAACRTFAAAHATRKSGGLKWKDGVAFADRKKELEALSGRVTAIHNRYRDKITAKIEADLKSYRAGRARKPKIVGQGFKHTIKPVADVAKIPISILEKGPFAALSVVLAIKDLAVDMKQSVTFFQARYRSFEQLEVSLEKHLNFYTQSVQDANGQARKYKQVRPEILSIDEKKHLRHEIKAKVLVGLFAVHKKSLTNLEYNLNKMSDKIDELRYFLLRAVKKLDKLKAKMPELKKAQAQYTEHCNKTWAAFLDLDKQMKATGTKKAQKAAATARAEHSKGMKKLEKARKQITELERGIAAAEKNLKELERKFGEKDRKFNSYRKGFKKIQKAMPTVLPKAEAIADLILYLENLAEANMQAVMEVSSASGAMGSVDLAGISDKVVSSAETLSTITGGTEDALNSMGDSLEKAKTTTIDHLQSAELLKK